MHMTGMHGHERHNGHGHMITWRYGIEFVYGINSYARNESATSRDNMGSG